LLQYWKRFHLRLNSNRKGKKKKKKRAKSKGARTSFSRDKRKKERFADIKFPGKEGTPTFFGGKKEVKAIPHVCYISSVKKEKGNPHTYCPVREKKENVSPFRKGERKKRERIGSEDEEATVNSEQAGGRRKKAIISIRER